MEEIKDPKVIDIMTFKKKIEQQLNEKKEIEKGIRYNCKYLKVDGSCGIIDDAVVVPIKCCNIPYCPLLDILKCDNE